MKKLLLLAFCLAAVAVCKPTNALAQQKYPAFFLGANDPKGEGKGIFPGRVVWGYAPGTATWDGKTGNWFDDEYNDQDKCDELVLETIKKLTGEPDAKKAWKALFTSFNKAQGHTGGYKKGEKVAIKINQNNTSSQSFSRDINISPQLVLSVLRSLVNKGEVPQKMITVGDPSRFLTDDVYIKCSTEFPNVIYMDNAGGNGRTKSTYEDNAIHYSSDNGMLAKGIAMPFVEATYNIDMAILKGHEGQGVTLCAKNWYGATSIYSDYRKNHHNNFDSPHGGEHKYLTFVDYMGHKDLGGKTMLYLVDGLYGSGTVGGVPTTKWKMEPFNGEYPNSLFASQDPVAIDAVCLDFLATEFPAARDMDYADGYMLEAATIPNSPSGTKYAPSGTPLTHSLGVVEHWNNPIDKQYSRNLGKKEGIELIKVRFVAPIIKKTLK